MPTAKVRYCPKAKQEISMCYEAIGNPYNHPLFLVAGLNCSLLYWPLPLCQKLASMGFYVVRFDNRDVGLSSRLDHLPTESVCSMLCCCNCCVEAPYGLDDMAIDVLELVRLVLDARDADFERFTFVTSAAAATRMPFQNEPVSAETAGKEVDFSICGMSQGGAIAQYAAIMEQNGYFSTQTENPVQGQREVPVIPKLNSLSLIMTFAEKPPIPPYRIIEVLTSVPKDDSKQALVEWGVNMAKTIFFIPQEWTPEIEKDIVELFEAVHDRIPNDQISSRHRQAVARQKSRMDLLKMHLGKLPTIIIHGAKDELVPVEYGRQLHKVIPNSKYYEYPTMSHSILPRHFEEVCGLVALNAGLPSGTSVDAVKKNNNNEPIPSENTPLMS